jgi:hypothetical protein
MALKRREAAAAANGSQAPIVEPKWAEVADLLLFLSDPRWEDGSPRDLGSLTVFADDGKLKACLNDRGAGMVAFVSSDTLVGLLEAASRAAGGSGGDWRTSKPKGRPGR